MQFQPRVLARRQRDHILDTQAIDLRRLDTHERQVQRELAAMVDRPWERRREPTPR